MLRLLLALLLATALAPLPAHAKRAKKIATRLNDLMRVVSPPARGPAVAHPFVNIVVRFGRTNTGVPADPATFRAHLGRSDITSLFTDIVEGGVLVGKRARVEPPLVREGKHPTNRLRLEVRTPPVRTRGRKPKPLRDIDRLRFRAVHAADQPPRARALAGTDVVLPAVPTTFDATSSTDPDGDTLTYLWDFGDGTTSTDPRPTHAFGVVDGQVTVRLTVSDTQLSATDDTVLPEVPGCDAGRTPGLLHIDAAQALEFGAVAPGTSTTRTVVVSNTDTTAGSQLKVRLQAVNPAFAANPGQLDLGPGESAPVTVTFAPGGPGHASSPITAVVCAANRRAVHLLAHGFGGTAPPNASFAGGPPFAGPTLAADPVFYTIGFSAFGILSSGLRFPADNTVHTCQNAGVNTGDACLSDADCPAGGSCPATGTCSFGAHAGQPCASDVDCPGGRCPAIQPFEPLDICGDGSGGLYLLNDNSFTDANPPDTGDRTGGILRLQFDPTTGARTLAALNPGRTTAQTTQLACDGQPASAGGQLYVPQYFTVPAPGSVCPQGDRDQREELDVFDKRGNGQPIPLFQDVDAAAGYDPCDDFDPVADLEIARDGSAVFVSLPFGLFRIRPAPALPISPDIDDFFQVHPDGSIVYVTANDSGTSGVIKVYKIFPEQAQQGAPRLSDLTPCATFTLPNNLVPAPIQPRGTAIDSFAADRAAPGSFDAVVLVSFVATGGGNALSSSLGIRGTVAFSSPAGSSTCTPLGIVNLELLDQLTF